MDAKRKAKIRRLAQKRFENICNRCGEGNLHWLYANSGKWYLANNAQQPHKCNDVRENPLPLKTE